MAERPRILVAEPDEATAAFVVAQLDCDGYATALAIDAPAALAIAHARAPALMLLGDLEPARDALELVAAIRAGYAGAADPQLPIISLSCGGELAALRAFSAGVDDVVAKPFSYPQLLARIAALLRRCRIGPPSDPIRVGMLEIDPVRRLVRVGGRPVVLRPREYELLLHLAGAPERVFLKDELLRELWAYRSASLSRTLDNTAATLRRKLGGDLVLTVWGIGYRLVGPAALPVPASP